MYPWYIIADHTQISFGRGSRIGADTMIAYNDTSNLHRIHAVSFSTTEASDGEFVIADNSGRTPNRFHRIASLNCFNNFCTLILFYPVPFLIFIIV